MPYFHTIYGKVLNVWLGFNAVEGYILNALIFKTNTPLVPEGFRTVKQAHCMLQYSHAPCGSIPVVKLVHEIPLSWIPLSTS